MTPRLRNGQFPKGTSGNPRGRPKADALRVEVRELARELVCSATYLHRVGERLLAGRLNPRIEALLWFYAHGKPVERVRLEDGNAAPPFVVRDWDGRVLGVVVLGVGSFERCGDDGDAVLFKFAPTGPPDANPPRLDDAA